MRLVIRAIAAGGVAAFFFFSWIIQLLWNSMVAGHLGFGPPLSYWQAAALWFLTSILLAWVGIGSQHALWGLTLRDQLKRKIRRAAARWAETDEDLDDLGEAIEQKIKRGLGRWADAGIDADWDELGERIERKVKQKIRDWTNEE